MKYYTIIVSLSILTIMPWLWAKDNYQKLDNVFYCFNNGVRTLPNAPKDFDTQAALVKKLGFDGLAGHMEENYYPLRNAMDKVGLPMPEIYIKIATGKDGNVVYHKDLKNILIDSKKRNLLVALHLHNNIKIKDSNKADQIFIEGIQKLADFCDPLNIKIAIYPHAGFHCETVAHSVKLAKAIDRKNVGVIFNTCHYLKVEGSRNWKNAIQLALPYLFMVSINGADDGDTKNMGWERLIQPLGEGTFDTYQIVKFLKDNNYTGLFGLQCYNIKQDCEKALTKSINTWKSYRQRYIQDRK